jgi:hypothetical protein
MGSGERRGGAGGRVLEGRHVIGLFVLMLLFSGVFFTLGYVMGRNQFDSQVRAAPTQPSHAPSDVPHPAKPGPASKPTASGGSAANPSDQPFSEWEFYKAGSSKPTSDHLSKPVSSARTVAASGSGAAASSPGAPAAAKTAVNAPLIPGGAYVLQVAALTKETDALVLAGSLQKKKFPARSLPTLPRRIWRPPVLRRF